ncbi:MAG TPA: ATP-binding cassette domain-containing protein [Gemmatimonadaceae bacterium]|nr:ATP-binding cassette domain-containing protein [Gemmatimonadaceae bacterium]
MNTSCVLSIRSLSKIYHVGLRGCTASARALDDVDLEIRRGEVVAVVGAANAGKTTLLRCAAGLLSPDDGTIERGHLADVRAVTKFVESPVELARLRSTEDRWDLAMVDNVDLVRGDVGSAFALMAAARLVRQSGGALLLAARDAQVVAHVADRVLVLERGRLTRVNAPATPSAARVAESWLRD